VSAQGKRYHKAQVSPSGRLSLPADFRKAVGLEKGGTVIVELDGNDIRVRTVQEAVARAQALARRLFSDRPDVSVDDFLANRREDWGEEL
jgi:bifunctional DNA-binding transcriptional regulator/antitoxin component of YhaV-PrlF toxin-antitoxin module